MEEYDRLNNKKNKTRKLINISKFIDYVLIYLNINRKKTCIGCNENILNQEAHMSKGGCLYNE